MAEVATKAFVKDTIQDAIDHSEAATKAFVKDAIERSEATTKAFVKDTVAAAVDVLSVSAHKKCRLQRPGG